MKLTSSQKKFLRYTIGVLIFPVAVIVTPLYRWYRRIALKKQTNGKVADIVNGFSYLVVKDSEIEKEARKRAEVCGGCRYAKYDKKINTIIVGETIHEIKGMYCDLCGCSLAGKLRSEDEHCPIRKW